MYTVIVSSCTACNVALMYITFYTAMLVSMSAKLRYRMQDQTSPAGCVVVQMYSSVQWYYIKVLCPIVAHMEVKYSVLQSIVGHFSPVHSGSV